MSIEILQDIAGKCSSTWHLAGNQYILVAVSTINITESLAGARPWGVVFSFYDLAGI